MACKLLCVLGIIFFGFSLANSRVVYVEDPPNSLMATPLRTSYPYLYPNEEIEQSSRDLDLSFSAGSPNDNSDQRVLVYPPSPRKIYYTPPSGRPLYDVDRQFESPVSYYSRVIDVPNRKIIYGDDLEPYSHRKILKIDNPGTHKGEIVLELRVTANGNSVNNAI